jgi:hypothetical protein
MVALMDQGLHYEVNGTGAPLLLIHGTGSSLRVWDPVIRRGRTTPAQKG